MIDDSVKFAWAYLIRHGKITNGKWCYYAGNWEEHDGSHNWKTWEKTQKELENFIQKIIFIGIDWNKTSIPDVDDRYEFNGTDNDSVKCLGTLGTLYLKNGESFLIGSSDDDAAHLVETAREILKGKDSKVLELSMKL